MSRKSAIFLLVAALLITATVACESPSSQPVPPKEEPGTVASEADAGPRFAIDQPATPAFTPRTITPTTITPTTITPTTITPTTIVPTTIVPRTVTPTTITPTPVVPTSISAARDLKGTWRGTGISYLLDGNDGTRVARTTWDVTLIITEQADNSVKGTLTMTTISQENLFPQNFPISNYGPDQITNGIVKSSTLDFDVDEWHWTFTFTTDLMSGQYTTAVGNACDPKAFNLTRQP